MSLGLVVCFINRGYFENVHLWTQMSKVVHLSQCTNKSCTLFICAVVSSTPDTGAASLGYQVHLTEEQLAWAIKYTWYRSSFTVFEILHCIWKAWLWNKTFKTKITFCKYIKICNLHIWKKAAPITRADLVRESSAERSDYKESGDSGTTHLSQQRTPTHKPKQLMGMSLQL